MILQMDEPTTSPEIDTAPYRLLKEIGHGAYGVVYLATGPEGFVALKICRCPEVGDHSSYSRECRGLAVYSRIPPHPGLIRIYSFYEDPSNRFFYYAMELADDECDTVGRDSVDPKTYRPKTLEDVLSAEVALTLQESLSLAIHLTEAVVHLQRHHLVHRDIKPGNVLMIQGRAVLADIGLMNDIREASSIVGTPGYVPPENHGSMQGDVFSLGMTLYRASTGRTVEERGLAPRMEADIDAPYFWRWMMIVTKATSPTISQRYNSAKALLHDLRALNRRARFFSSRKIRLTLISLAVGFGLWGAWNFPFFRTWMTKDASFRYHVPLPWPYRLLQPFLAPWHDPCGPGSAFHMDENGFDNIPEE